MDYSRIGNPQHNPACTPTDRVSGILWRVFLLHVLLALASPVLLSCVPLPCSFEFIFLFSLLVQKGLGVVRVHFAAVCVAVLVMVSAADGSSGFWPLRGKLVLVFVPFSLFSVHF